MDNSWWETRSVGRTARGRPRKGRHDPASLQTLAQPSVVRAVKQQRWKVLFSKLQYLPDEELAALHVFAKRVAKGVKAAIECRRIGVAVIGLEVPHAHIHLIPMQTVSDMNFANPKLAPTPEALAATAARIREKIG